VKNVVQKYLSLYSSDSPKWDNVTDLAESLGWTEMITKTTSQYFADRGVSSAYIHELIEAATRVNYGQVRTFIILLLCVLTFTAEC
jgi:prenylcysteine oxidase/farnesylcysteine lyase